MPMMVEPLVFKENQDAGGYMVNGDEEKIMPLVRQAVELGADIIKADPTDDVSQYHRVVEVAGEIPVLVRGGGKVSDEEVFVHKMVDGKREKVVEKLKVIGFKKTSDPDRHGVMSDGTPKNYKFYKP